MAIRQTTHILKNSDIINRPLPSSLLKGEPIVNTADGIVFFSGYTTSTSGWTAAGTGMTAGFFEVGSNLYDLRLRNRITQYEGVSGVGLANKILSGTTSGLTLVDSSNINGISAFTYDDQTNTFTIYDSNGTPYPATFQSVSGLTVNGNFNVTGDTILNFVTANTISATTITVDDINVNDDVFISGDLTVTGNTNLQQLTATTTNINGDLTVTGGTNIQQLTATTTNINGNLTVTGDTSLQSLSATSIFVSGFVPTQVVYVGPSGELTGENAFTYDENTDTLNVTNVEANGNVIIQGDLTVFGTSISAFTTNLFVEDPNIFLNYNPTGSTTVTSVNAGFTIQDGNGVATNNVNFDIVRMENLTGLTPTQIPDVSEYTGPTGYNNRGWITQLNDIVIRSLDVTDGGSAGDINGVRVLAEWDILDGGSY